MFGTSDFTGAQWLFVIGNLILAVKIALSPQIEGDQRPIAIFVVIVMFIVLSSTEIVWVDGKRAEALSSHQIPRQAVIIPAPVSAGSGGIHTGGPSTPNGILPPNSIQVAPDKPKSKAAPIPKPPESKTTVIQNPPYGNLAARCDELGDEIISVADERKKERPDPAINRIAYNAWYMQNDGIYFHARLYPLVAKLHRDLTANNLVDARLDELIEEHERYFESRQRNVQEAIAFPQAYHLSNAEIREIGERLKFLAIQVPH
jgi:hypothetical protein